jgi:hypothetical protein
VEIGNGKRFSFSGALQVTGTDAIGTDFCDFNAAEFTNLAFSDQGGDTFEFNPANGEITFKVDGNADIKGILNIDTSSGISEVQISTVYNDGTGWALRNARKAELPVIGAHQTVAVGTLPDVRKGHKLKFSVKSSDGNASFLSEVLSNTSLIPAVLLQIMVTRR